MLKITKVFAFDYSETLATGSETNDQGCGQPMMVGSKVIPNAYEVMLGGMTTAQLLIEASQLPDLKIVVVSNNGQSTVDNPTARSKKLLQKYGLNISEADFYTPDADVKSDSDKVKRLDRIAAQFGIAKDAIHFWDDSRNNVLDAQKSGYVNAVRVTSAEVLQQTLRAAIEQHKQARANVTQSVPASNTNAVKSDPKVLDQKALDQIATTLKEKIEFLYAQRAAVKNPSELVKAAGGNSYKKQSGVELMAETLASFAIKVSPPTTSAQEQPNNLIWNTAMMIAEICDGQETVRTTQLWQTLNLLGAANQAARQAYGQQAYGITRDLRNNLDAQHLLATNTAGATTTSSKPGPGGCRVM